MTYGAGSLQVDPGQSRRGSNRGRQGLGKVLSEGPGWVRGAGSGEFQMQETSARFVLSGIRWQNIRMVLQPADKADGSEADWCAVRFALPRHGRLARCSEARGACSPCLEPAEGTAVGPGLTPLRAGPYLSKGGLVRAVTSVASSPAGLPHRSCLFLHKEQAEGCVPPWSECRWAPFTLRLWK